MYVIENMKHEPRNKCDSSWCAMAFCFVVNWINGPSMNAQSIIICETMTFIFICFLYIYVVDFVDVLDFFRLLLIRACGVSPFELIDTVKLSYGEMVSILEKMVVSPHWCHCHRNHIIVLDLEDTNEQSWR